MRYIILLLLPGIISINAFSQESGKEQTEAKKIKEFKQVINRQFTKVTTGTAFSNLGNFTSISTDAKSFSFGGNHISKESVWGLEFSGGATEGIFKLFNNEKLNSNFSGEIKYHKIIKRSYGSRDAFEVSDIEDQIAELNNQFKKDSLAVIHQKSMLKLQMDSTNSANKIRESILHISKIDTLLHEDRISVQSKDSLLIIKKNLLYEMAIHESGITVLREQLNKIRAGTEDFFDEELFRKYQAKEKKLNELEEKKLNISLQEFDFSWVSFGLKVLNNDFKIFELNNIPGKQFIDTNFVSQRLSAAISRYRSTFKNNDIYWSVGIQVDFTSNFNLLNKVEIEERVPISSNPQQEIKKTINAYTGDYKEGLFDLTIFYDLYKFLGQNNSLLGIHLNPSLNYGEQKRKALTNLFLGVVVPFSQMEQQKSRINVEIFYNRQDVFNNLRQEVKSSSFGIRATFPITFINNNL